jgi:tRNA pseudouridine38-40 synthase
MLEVSREGPRITLVTEASGYLYKMVRSLAGCLQDVGTGKIGPDDVEAILHSKVRTARVATAPAEGLTMTRVYYP